MRSPAHTAGMVEAGRVGSWLPGTERPDAPAAVAAWLEWQALAGVSDCLADDRLADDTPAVTAEELALEFARGGAAPANDGRGVWPLKPAIRPAPPIDAGSTAENVERARQLAAEAADLVELGQALDRFDGCALKSTASRLCYADGAPDAALMVLGEAPGSDDDRSGIPFSGAEDHLLDLMLRAIGLDRDAAWLTNTVFWRPPGNRAPTPAEIAICLPFLERQIELLRPVAILVLGGPAARTLLGRSENISRLRARAYRYAGPGGIEAASRVTYHPQELVREPYKKRLAWRDLLEVQALLLQTAPAAHDPEPAPDASRRGLEGGTDLH